MNNALLNGLSTNALNNSFPFLQNTDQKENGSGFAALLEKNLFSGLNSDDFAFKANESFADNRSNERCCFEQNSFGLTMSKKASDNQKVKSKENILQEQNKKLEDTERVEKKQEKKTNKSKKNETFDEKLEAVKKELIRLTGSEQEAEELIAGFSDQELVALNQIIENLDQKSLDALGENPELLTDIIKEEISSLPDSDQKQKLLATLDSQELGKLTAKLAEIASESKKQVEDVPKMTNEGSQQVHEVAEEGLQNKETNEVLSEKQNNSKTEFDSRKAASFKDTKHAKSLKNNNQNSEISQLKNSEESLRQEFAKINKTESTQSETTAQNPENSSEDNSEPVLTSNKNAFKVPVKEAQAEQMGAQAAVKKFVETLMNNKTAGSAKEGSFTYSPQTKQGNGSSNFQNNSGSGFSNGFSSNYGANGNSIAGNKPAASPNNSVFLSQLIEKAEMLKTNDGKKILTMKLDPKELGKMEMELTSRDGNLTARISAESELAKIKLEQLSQQIKEHLNEQGINLKEITVDISSQNPDERNRQQLSDSKNKSSRIGKFSKSVGEQIIKTNVLPNLRSVALNIQSVDLTV